MKNLNLKKNIERRFFLLSALKGISFGVLSWRLFDLQVIENKKYDKLSEKNQFTNIACAYFLACNYVSMQSLYVKIPIIRWFVPVLN